MRGKKLWRQAVPELVHYQKSGNYITPHSSRNVILSEKNLGKEIFTKIVEALKTQTISYEIKEMKIEFNQIKKLEQR